MVSGSGAFSTPPTTVVAASSSASTSSKKRARIMASLAAWGADDYAEGAGENNNNDDFSLEELKAQEVELARMLAEVRRKKLSALQSKPLTIGVMGFGRFGQFIAQTFQKYGRVVVTSRSDYTDIALNMGVTYIPMSDLDSFMSQDLDVVVVATSILSFESTIQTLVPYIERDLDRRRRISNGVVAVKGPLFVDVLSVKEHARQVMLDLLPKECDILCTHPMFGPDSGKHGWTGLNFVYEKTRMDTVVLEPDASRQTIAVPGDPDYSESEADKGAFVDADGMVHSVHEDSESHVESVDRMERFLSIWEEEGCRMVPMSCKAHDAYAANSQFITHLMGRILGSQGLAPTPIDTKGFESVLRLVGSTTADSFDLFYGLYKFNQNSLDTIVELQSAMEDVVQKLKEREEKEQEKAAPKNVAA